MASARGLGGAGQALIGIGEGIMQVGGIDAQNRAEEVKLAALNSTQRMESDMQMYRWGSESDTQKEQFERSQSEAEAARKSQDAATAAQLEWNKIIETRGLDIKEKQVTADIAIQLKRFGLDKDKFGLLEKEFEERKKMNLKEMTLKEKQFFHAVAIDKANVAISEGRLDIAQQELDLAKTAQQHKEIVDLRKLEQTDASLTENIRQFDANITLREAELALSRAKIEAGIKNDDERLKIEDRIATIRGELAELEKDKFELAEKKNLQDKAYNDAILALKGQEMALSERGMVIKEGMLVIEKGKASRGKWTITTVPVYGEYTERNENTGIDEIKHGKIGERLVAINTDEPGLKDDRILEEDGSWKNGTPDGWKSDYGKILSVIQKAISEKGYTLDQAIDTAKQVITGFDEWDVIEGMFITIPSKEPVKSSSDNTGNTNDEETVTVNPRQTPAATNNDSGDNDAGIVTQDAPGPIEKTNRYYEKYKKRAKKMPNPKSYLEAQLRMMQRNPKGFEDQITALEQLLAEHGE